MKLDWRDATRADRPGIQSFACTTPPPKEPGKRAPPHPKPWEYAVQKAIHQVPVPLRNADGRLLVGITEDGGIGAVSLWSEMHGRVKLFKIRIIAISVEFRGRSAGAQPGEVASEALDVTLQEMSKAGPGGRVFGLIDKNNHASQRLVSAHGFQLNLNFPVENPNPQAWLARLPDDETTGPRHN